MKHNFLEIRACPKRMSPFCSPARLMNVSFYSWLRQKIVAWWQTLSTTNTISVPLYVIVLFSLQKNAGLECWPYSDWPNTISILGLTVLVANTGWKLWFIHQRTPSVCSFGEGNTIYHVDSSRASSSTSVKVKTNATKNVSLLFSFNFCPFWLTSVKA